MAQYRMKFGDHGVFEKWQERVGPRYAWKHTRKAIGIFNSNIFGQGGGLADWVVGNNPLYFQAHHLSDIIKGIERNLTHTRFKFRDRMGHVRHEYWQSARKKSTLTFANFNRPGHRAIAEKIQHVHKISIAIGERFNDTEPVISLQNTSISGRRLAGYIRAQEGVLEKSGSANQDIGEEIFGGLANILDIFR